MGASAGGRASTPGSRRVDAPRVLVAGHICLDVIPRLAVDRDRRALVPGALEVTGPPTLAVGGCVGNTGIALHRLGVRTVLVARVGDDAFGKVLGGLVHAALPRRSVRLITTPGGRTSCSVVHNRPGEDRAIQHFPGVNDDFVASDVPATLLRDVSLLHVGYPPLMARLVADEGAQLHELLAAARAHGVVTSLDMAAADRDPGGAPVLWPDLLRRVLPEVDVFLPSLEEASHLLGRTVDRDAGGAASLAGVARLADEMLDRGVAIAGVKLGAQGLYLRTGTAERVGRVPWPLGPAWARRELWSPVFETHVVGTTGAGDATIAGFLLGLLRGLPPVETLTTACAVGGSSTEAADGTSGILPWGAIEARLRGGWRRRGATSEAGWARLAGTDAWHGPSDAEQGPWPGPDGHADAA